MSTYFSGTLYIKENDTYKVVRSNLDFNCVKNFTSGWNIDAEPVSVDDKLMELHKNTDCFNSYDCEGVISIEDANKLFSADEIVSCLAAGGYYREKLGFPAKEAKPFVIYKEDISDELRKNLEEKFIKIDISEDLKLSTEEKAERDKLRYCVYACSKKVYRGKFYDVNSFDEVIKRAENGLKNIETKKAEWEKIRTSLDYLKLSSEEKENVFDSYKYEIEDEDGYYKYMLESALRLRHTLEFFSDWENKAYFYIYNEDCYE